MNSVVPLHQGEINIQSLVGEREQGILNSRIIKDKIPQAARSFLQRQEYFVVCASDQRGEKINEVWTTVLFGKAGFVKSEEDGEKLVVNLDQACYRPDDPTIKLMQPGVHLGFLFIELVTRRRLRVNGKVISVSGNEILLEVLEAYPNCPKYIQERKLIIQSCSHNDTTVSEGVNFTEHEKDILERSDTFFIGSFDPESGADASHRGGLRGFIKVLDEKTIKIPDYTGNSLFNTFGNISRQPKVGLVFIDFESRKIFQLTGTATLNLTDASDDVFTGETSRTWLFRCEKWILSSVPSQPEWGQVEYSSFNPKKSE